MIKAVLLDLDNTLLLNPDMTFARAFLEHFEQHFARDGIDNAASNMRKAIKVMGSQQRGDRTNKALLLSLLGDDIPLVEEVYTRFFVDVYPFLRDCIKTVDGARELILHLYEMDYQVVIATNPIYPESAVKQRMAWADLPLEEDLYALIGAADTMHFAKPDAAYYAEILGRVGVEPDEAIMVGDSQRNDILPAQKLGLHSFYVEERPLSELIDYLKELRKEAPPLVLHPDMIEPQFRGNMGAVYGMLGGVKPDYWHQRPDPKEWSIIQILCHLVTAENTIERPRLERILNEENPFITQPKPPGPNIEVCAEDGYFIADELLETRQQTIDFIRTFSADDWKRLARHSIFGLTTMLEMAYFTAQHDRLHLKQLCQTIGRCE